MTEKITEIHAESRGNYGAPRVHAALRQRGDRCGRRRVARLIRQAGLQGHHRSRRHRTTIPDPYDRHGLRREMRNWETRVRALVDQLENRLDAETRRAVFTDLREGEDALVVTWLGDWFGDRPELHLSDEERAELIALAEAVDPDVLARVSDAVAPSEPD
ncbi:IS3 family transposase [Streptomyces sp. NBC_00820]|uniref:IS3 family transposase n=1 Tax=Streptomyces sp. NBC_00820 TaxID=2975842 RepID=UPI003FA69A8F